ncbi:MAG: biopolymer transporter ExbD [Candidatus Omnitrophica bacterium]|nr:biopolymer transporter ExbD [Candidatus Omnitrophota bacterium]
MRIRFKKTVGEEVGLKQIDIAPLIDVVFQLLIFFMLTSSFISIPGINVKLPKTVTQEALNIQTLAVVITAQDILYVEDKPILLKELEELIKKKKYDAIFLKADKDASLGILVEVWDVCKRLGIEKIGIATTTE